METPPSRTPSQPVSPRPAKPDAWPRKVRLGRVVVTVYRRTMPNGVPGFMVANYAEGRRRFDSYSEEAAAMEAAQKLARQLSEREVVAASMTNGQAAEYSAAVQTLAPFGVTLPAVADTVAECLRMVGGLTEMRAAVKDFAARNRRVTAKPVAEVVEELLALKEARKASPRYLQDLRSRLRRFAGDCRKNCGDVLTSDVQGWLDGQQLAAQSYMNTRRVLHLLYKFATARGYAADNPVARVESVKVRGGATAIFTPSEMAKLLRAADADFLPSLAIGGFAGLRSAEIERLHWRDIHLAEKCIIVGAEQSKTASRRVVPISDNLAAWLVPYAQRTGPVWTGTHKRFYDAQQTTAERAEVPWKSNALRHSFASYRFAQLGDAGRVAGELGNSAAVVHRHYRELVKPDDAAKWFAIKPDSAENVVTFTAATA
jgi:integrase